MEYLKSQNKEKYKEEMADLFFKSAQLIKDPKGEPKSFYGAAIAGAILAGAGLFLTTFGLVSTLIKKQVNVYATVFFIVMYVFFIIIGLFSVLVLGSRKRIKNRPDNDNRIDCDKDGVIFITSQGERKTYWDNYQAIRAFKYTMAFIPKDRKGMYLLVPIENLQNVTTFLEENGINIDVIR
jgi:hypothetical protein